MTASGVLYFQAACVMIGHVGQVDASKAKDAKPGIAAGVMVTYLANEGVLLTAGGKGVLIDALFRGGVTGYAQVQPATLSKLERAEPPYDKISLVLVTHRHGDHFDRESVATHLANNKRAVLLSCEQVTKSVHQAAIDTGPMAARIRDIHPQGSEKIQQTVDGIAVDVLKLSHGGGRFANVLNFGFIVHLGGKRILHIGDAHLNDATRAPLEQHAVGVDVACVPYWWLMDGDGRAYVRDVLKPKQVIAFHIPPAEADEVARIVNSTMPGAHALTKLMESRQY